MKKLLLIALAGILFSCSSDSGTGLSSEGTKLKKTILTPLTGPPIAATYDYEGDQISAVHTSGQLIKYIFDDGKLVETKLTGSSSYNGSYVYHYSSQGEIEQVTGTGDYAPMVVTVEHLADGTIKAERFQDGEHNATAIFHFDAAGRIIQKDLEVLYSTWTAETYLYEYDDKNNPFHYPFERNFDTAFTGTVFPAQNNVTAITTVNNPGDSTSMTYEYNSAGYPTAMNGYSSSGEPLWNPFVYLYE